MLITCAHFYFAYLEPQVTDTYHAIIGYLMIGLAYCLFATASWAMIPFVVDEKVVGTAFGIGFAFENVGNVFGPTIVGIISVKSQIIGIEGKPIINYSWVSIFLGTSVAIGLVMNIILIFVDQRNGGVLMATDAA